MREMSIALVAIHRGDEYFMHKRNGDSARGAVGLIGFIGGEFERGKDKKYLDAAVRETNEETGLSLPPALFDRIGLVNFLSDRASEPLKGRAVGFDLPLPANMEIPLVDPRDEPVTAVTGEIIEEYLGKNRLAPATEAMFIKHILKGVIYLGPVDN